LSLVRPIRRYWSAFNEYSQTLEFYQAERDLTNHKNPIENIPLQRAAITLSTIDERAFIIMYVRRHHRMCRFTSLSKDFIDIDLYSILSC
jgi:hypothetical protein